ncbi:hypothetical protein KC19_10G110000 [Ceratodon purpureus]|uniref:Subtilisin-like protease n=1 Tax=Ceratodon purpureus TaxID=3225 RepID=A0A8T0GJ56_CERPU|nr:hypothetical protein KC19_10G110000 [Ceratodon purpureus]
MEKIAGVVVLFGLWVLITGQGAATPVHVNLNDRKLSTPTTDQDHGQTRTYIAHMTHSLTHGNFEMALSKYSQLLQTVKQASAHPLHVYHSACHGFSAHLTSQEAEALRQVDGVLGVFPDKEISLQTTRTPEFLGLSTLKGLWPDGHFGDDVIVGMIDSGVWPESNSFSDVGLGPIPARWKGTCETGPGFNTSHCNRKLIGARYFYAAYEKKYNISLNSTREFMSARDAQGHGTHTASTAAGSPVSSANLFGSANGTARGMAPKARIAVYKVCWLDGNCAESDILAAIDQAVADGVDIISLSLGDPVVPYTQDNLAIGAFGAVKKGIFVSCAGGNNGSFGLGTVTNIAPWVMTAAASTVDRTFPANVELGDGQILSGLSLYQLGGGQAAQLIAGVNASTAGNDTASAKCLAGSLNPALVKGKIVVCERGENLPVEKGAEVQAVGGAGMILTNTALEGESIRADAHYLPSSHVGARAGSTILTYMNANPSPVGKFQFVGSQLGVKPAPMVASFSSRGPNSLTPQVLKPDIAAPGVNILAAWTGAVGPSNVNPPDTRKVDFNIISGTSMACPHITGLAALLKAAHPDWSPSAIKSAMMTTATLLDNTGGAITDQATNAEANPFLYGSGHVQPERALDPGLVYDMGPQDYVNFLCASNVTAQEILLFTHNETATCPESPVRIEDMNYPSFSAVFEEAPSLLPISMNMTRTVTNVGNANATYTAQVVAPSGIQITVQPDVLSFLAMNETKNFTLQVTTVNTPDSSLEGISVTQFAFLVWSDGPGTHLVQSPIAISVYK